jgi:hypothetical protein
MSFEPHLGEEINVHPRRLPHQADIPFHIYNPVIECTFTLGFGNHSVQHVLPTAAQQHISDKPDSRDSKIGNTYDLKNHKHTEEFSAVHIKYYWVHGCRSAFPNLFEYA